MKKKIKLFNRISLINKKFNKKQFYHYFDVPNVAIIVPIIKKKFIVVSQRREPINKNNFEFPCGWVDIGESPAKSSARELYEETGYKCIKKPKKLLEFFEEPGRLNSKAICFFSDKIIKLGKPEKGIKVYLLTKKEIHKLIIKKKFNNASHIVAFYYYLYG